MFNLLILRQSKMKTNGLYGAETQITAFLQHSDVVHCDINTLHDSAQQIPKFNMKSSYCD